MVTWQEADPRGFQVADGIDESSFELGKHGL